MISATMQGSLAAGTSVRIVATDGTVVADFAIAKLPAPIVFSSPNLASGSTYNLVVDGTTTGTVTAT